MDYVIKLLQLQKESRDAKRVQDLGFIIANKTQQIFPFKQSVFWTYRDGKIDLVSISGSGTLDRQGPYALWLKDIIRNKANDIHSHDIIEVKDDENSPQEWLKYHHYILPLWTEKDGLIGGLWIDNDMLIYDEGSELLFELTDHYAHCLSLLFARESRKRSFLSFGQASSLKKCAIIAAILLFFCPVQLKITAPAEIVAANPVIVTAPFDGILDDIHVTAGENVKEGDHIATMDKTTLQAQKDSAEQSFKTSQTALSRAGFESLRTAERKSDLQALRSEIATKKIEFDYAADLLKDADIKAPKDGVAIFSDASSLKGKPMRAGERILLIANPEDSELLIRVPADSLLPISVDDPVTFYLNTAPLNNHDAVITSMGYQASADSDGLLTYKIRADIQDKNNLRIGWKGTAKIKSSWSILGYALLRRPLIAFRNLTGL
jgi:hypothetical protein